MQIAKLTEAVKRKPFEPFVIVTSSGGRYLVNHPEFVWLTKGAVYVSQPVEQPEAGEMVTDPAVISYMHISEIVPAPECAA